jgi:hypothetical protein
MELDGHEKGVYTLAALPNGQLASGSRDNNVTRWTGGEEQVSIIGQIRTHAQNREEMVASHKKVT